MNDADLGLPTERVPCALPYQRRPCEEPRAVPPAPPPAPPRGALRPPTLRGRAAAIAALFGLLATTGVGLEPPPRRGR